jgi:hypothetical protein
MIRVKKQTSSDIQENNAVELEISLADLWMLENRISGPYKYLPPWIKAHITTLIVAELVKKFQALFCRVIVTIARVWICNRIY